MTREPSTDPQQPADYDRPSLTVDAVILTVREDALHVLAVRYDRPENPRFLHVVRDELREIEDGLLLGRMVVQGAGGARWWLWFGLER